ncbi:beta-ketoacyl-ACP synthase [Pararhizobium haloflavum]|uniref:beta-ketoacyl-ACP synthase n=1 Tax=Pararhizobium haloflavum TaxID=2037914 RepID=UPI000C178A93|nr:beta-ketoacyl-ACP synthase [Pararhizobium haloflavum]
MKSAPHDVVVTGVGIVTCQGVGRAAHESLVTATEAPQAVVDNATYAPYPIHPLPEVDWSEQIPRRGDQRQMDQWQRLGVFTAGLALADAGLKDDADACATMDMIVAAGGGERDLAVDTLIIDEAANHNDRERLLNQKLMTELRPTLFLAQLSNLMAGNISIVHKVTGSSRTFMGEESAGISAVETAYGRIRAGQSTHALVGGAHVAERPDMHFVFEAINALAQGDRRSLWDRGGQAGGGIVLGSAAAFLVLESREHAEARGAPIYAVLDAVGGDRGPRGDGIMEDRLARMIETVPEPDLVLSGASGLIDLSARERHFLQKTLPKAALRGYSNVTGHGLEAQFPLGIALAALALKAKGVVPPLADGERKTTRQANRALVTTIGYVRGEGIAALSATGDRP